MPKAEDLTGKRFGRLMVVERSYSKKTTSAVWLCKCDCGNQKSIPASDLRRGYTTSCGCWKRERITTHGGYKTKEYLVWNTMVHRCTNPNAQHYERYGGRGIEVCKRWMKFENFIADMGLRPSLKHSIERIDNDKGYSPDNCKWATRSEQYHNRGLYKNSTSGYPGVTWNKRLNKWRVRITVDSKEVHVGVFEILKDALEARQKAEKTHWKSS